MIPPGTPEWPESLPISRINPDEIPVRLAEKCYTVPYRTGDDLGVRTQMDGVGYLIAPSTEEVTLVYRFVEGPNGIAWYITDPIHIKAPWEQVMAQLPSYLIRSAL